MKIVYQPALGQPKQSASVPQPDWISSVAGIDEFFASGCYDGTVKLYTPAGKVVASALASDQAVTCIDVASTSQEVVVAVGSKDCTVKLFTGSSSALASAGDGAEVTLSLGCRTDGHDTAVTCVRFAPSGQLLASSSWDGSITIWDVEQALANKDEAWSAAGAGGASSAPVMPSVDKKKKKRRRGSTAAEDEDGDGVPARTTSLPAVDLPRNVDIVPQPQCVAGLTWLGGDRVAAGGYDHCLRLYDVDAGGREIQSFVRIVVN